MPLQNRTGDWRTLLPPVYLSVVWLTPQFRLPLGPFDGIPLYVVFTALVLALLRFEVKVYFLVTLALLILYEALKSLQFGFEFTTKGFLGLFALAAIFVANHFSLIAVGRLNNAQIGKWLRYVLFLLSGSILFDLLILGPAGVVTSGFRHYFLPIQSFSGFFAEPSVLGLALPPFIFLLIFRPALYLKYLGKTSLFALLLIVLLCPSATLLAIIALTAFVRLLERGAQGRLIAVLIGAPLLLVFSWALLTLPEFAIRLTGALGLQPTDVMWAERNFSSLVFVKGEQMAWYALRHFPLGVAFLNNETLALYVPISRLSKAFFDQNSKDNATILFRGICEFGWPFIVFAMISLYRLAKHIVLIDTYSLYQSVLVSFEFTFLCYFVRGGNYFAGAISISLALLFFQMFPTLKRGSAGIPATRRRPPLTPLQRFDGQKT